MDPEQLNASVWKAHIQATFELAGLNTSFNNQSSAFYLAPGTQSSFIGQMVPLGGDPNTIADPSTTTVKNSPDAQLNKQLLSLADTLISKSTPFYSPSSNKREFGVGVY